LSSVAKDDIKGDMIESYDIHMRAHHAPGSLTHRILMVVLMLLFSQIIWASPTAERRIQLKKGQTVAYVKGTLRHIHDEANFVLRARAGQHMRITITGEGPTRGVVTFPSGQQDGGPGGLVFDDRLPKTGDYRIRVTESSMGEEWQGRFFLEVSIR
jgi:hypothetical protein